MRKITTTYTYFFLAFLFFSISLNSQNLLVNGNFETTGGYQSNYSMVAPSGNSNSGDYAIAVNSQPMNTANFISSADHTSGLGKMMVVDGRNNDIFWKQNPNIALQGGSTYMFSYYIKNINSSSANQPKILFTPADQCDAACVTSVALVEGNSDLSLMPAGWQKVSYRFTPTAPGIRYLRIELSTINAGLAGNDFAIDDVSLSLLPPCPTTPPAVTSPTYLCQGSSASALTATPDPGNTLLWYAAATGGVPSVIAPTPSTAVNGTTTYYVSQTNGVCDGPRAAINVIVNSLTGNYNLHCDSNLATQPNSVYFDWNNLPGPPIYHIFYSIGGGPMVNIQTNISHYEVLNVPANQSVTLTIALAEGFPCVPSSSNTCCAASTTPVFASVPATVCYGTTAPTLPATSDNGISGSWSPSTVSNTANGSYVFTPNPTTFPCAISITKNITIIGPNPGTLSGNQTVCVGGTTTFSSTTPGGTWASSDLTVATINTTSGVITGIAPGTAIMTYFVASATPQCSPATKIRQVTVIAGPSPGTLSGNQNTCVGGNTLFSSTVPGGTWTSSNTAVATVNNITGDVAGVTAGTATITYTVSAPNGCTGTATRTVTINALPTAGTLSGNQNICVGLTTTFTSTVTGGSWTSGNAAIATVNATTGVVTGVSAGTATLTYTVTGTGGCANATAMRTVTVTAPSSAGTLSGNQNVCVGLGTTFSSTVPGGAWSSLSPAVATVNATGNVTGVSAGTTTITYTVTGTGGCSNASATRTVTVTAAPNAGTLSGTSNICIGSTSQLTSTGSGGSWSSSNPAIVTVSASGIITGISAGNATINYNVTGTGGCANVTASIAANITAPPNAGTLSGTQNVCVGLSTTFSSSTAGGTWSSLSPAIATVNATGNVTGISAGTTTITYTVTGTGGCSNASATRTITVTAAPNAGTLTGTSNICIGSTSQLTTTGSGGSWSSSNSAIVTVNTSGLITGIAAGSATINYNVIGTGGCSNVMASIGATVTAPPNAGTLSGTQSICEGTTTTFTSTAPGGSWTSDNTSVATVNTAGLVSGVAPGTATIRYTASGTGGCANAIATRTITVIARQVPTFNPVAPICEGATLTPLPTTSTNGFTGTWSPALDNTMTTTYNFLPNSTSCATPTTLTITVRPKLTPVFSLIPIQCVNDPAVPVLPTVSQNGVSGTWSPSTVSLATAGTQTYTFTPNASECVTAGPFTLTVTVVPHIVPNFQPIAPFCYGKTNLPTLDTTSPNGVEGTWLPPVISNTASGDYTFTPNTIVNQCAEPQVLHVTVIPKTLPDFPQVPFFCVNTTAPILTNVSPNGVNGTWQPSVIDNTTVGTSNYLFTPDPGECALNQTLVVTVTPGIVPNFEDIAICSTATPPLLNPVSPNGVNGTWTPPAIDMSLIGTNPYLFTPLTGECGVPQTINVTINEYTLNHIEGIVSNYFEDLQVITVIASNSGNYLYQLDYGPVQESNVFNYVPAGLHTITVFDANNCGPSLSDPNIMVITYPKFFTPNSDNYNDTWNITGLKDQNATIYIFDRYGKLIKQISPAGDGWDGKYHDEELPSSDYWFTVDYSENGVTKQFKSHFSLKR